MDNPQQAGAAGAPQELVDELGQVVSMVAQIARLVEASGHGHRRALEAAPPEAPRREGFETFSMGTRKKLAILRTLLEMRDPVIKPDLNPYAPRGHACKHIDELLEVRVGDSLAALDDLADLGLLQRELHNHVPLCPQCHRCQVIFREQCPDCSDIDIDIERLIHHFHCAYIGLESEFTKGLELACPKCRRELRQLGQDFERPLDTYACRSCEFLFEDPAVAGQCLHCAHEFKGAESEMAKIYRYRPTVLTVRAVEMQRLTGLDVSELMFDTNVRLATYDFLALETERELHRMRRYGNAISAVVVCFTSNGQVYPVFREWPAQMMRDFGASLTSTLRPLDLVARLDHSRVGMLLPETDAAGMVAVKQRLLTLLGEMSATTRFGQPLTLEWSDASWNDKAVRLENVLSFFDAQREPA